jgi:cyclase
MDTFSARATRIIDLSVPVDPRMWEPEPVRRTVIDHRRGADLLGQALAVARGHGWLGQRFERVKQRFGLGVDHRDFPDGKGLSLMTYALTTHTGTHMDAPYHYGDLSASGAQARTIDEVPLDWCYGDGVLIDVPGEIDDGPVSRREVCERLDAMGRGLHPEDIVLLRTAGDTRLGEPGYFSNFRGVSLEATEWILAQGVKVIGVDSFGFDPPFLSMLDRYRKTRDPGTLWPAHLYGRSVEYCQLERLTNLQALPAATGFKVACFPIKLTGGDAAWCRVVAIVEARI